MKLPINHRILSAIKIIFVAFNCFGLSTSYNNGRHSYYEVESEEMLNQAVAGFARDRQGRSSFYCEEGNNDLAANIKSVIEKPETIIDGKEYFCTVLTLLRQNTNTADRIASLESKVESSRKEMEYMARIIELHEERFAYIERNLNNDIRRTEDEDKSFIKNRTNESFISDEEKFKNKWTAEIDKKNFKSLENDTETILIKSAKKFSDQQKIKDDRWITKVENEREENSNIVMLKYIEEELHMKIRTESIRAQTREDQIVQMLNNEIQRAQKAESEIFRALELNMYRVTGDLVSEFNRAKTVEDSLEKRISTIISKVEKNEANIFNNVTREVKRIAEKVDHLQVEIFGQEAKTRKLELDLRWELNQEIKRSTGRDEELANKLGRLENQMSDLGSELKSDVNQALAVSSNAQNSLKELILEETHRAKDSESRVMSALMSEVSRALDSEKNLKISLGNEIDRFNHGGNALGHSLERNLTQLRNKMDFLLNQVRSEAIKNGISISELRRNSTTTYLVLTELGKQFGTYVEVTDARLIALETKHDGGKGGWFQKPKLPSFTSLVVTNTTQKPPKKGLMSHVFGMFGGKNEEKSERDDFNSTLDSNKKDDLEDEYWESELFSALDKE